MELINNSPTQIAVKPLGIIPSAYIPFTAIPSEQHDEISSSKSFIEANTLVCSLQEIKDIHTIPVFLKDNEPLISHAEFIETTWKIVKDVFHGEYILPPSIRVSHEIKNRIPEAKHKQACDLLSHETTRYFERMMFCLEIPSIQAEVGGNLLSLTIGGVKSYGEDNLFQRSNGDQHFSLFIGFQNKVCTNMCIFSDGIKSNIAVKGLSGLILNTHSLIRNYNSSYHINNLQRLTEHSLSEKLFATLIGRLRMYTHLPNQMKKNIPPILLTDNQINSVVRDYYKDKSFCRDREGNINCWKLYNLLTGSNRASYIDQFLTRANNAFNFVEQIRYGLENKTDNWYLNQD